MTRQKALIMMTLLALGSHMVLGKVNETGVQNINLQCESAHQITSPEYPADYPNNAHLKWNIEAPPGHRILINFLDYKLLHQDSLKLLEGCGTGKVHQYAGPIEKVFPFESVGHSLCVEFESNRHGRAMGFNLSISCDERHDPEVCLVSKNLPQEGVVELRVGDRKIKVCKDNFTFETATVMCREMGYPAAKEFSFQNGSCMSAPTGSSCTKAPLCGKTVYRIQDCVTASGSCLSSEEVKITCHEPGFMGCHKFGHQTIFNGTHLDSVPSCLSTCRDHLKDIAIIHGGLCACVATAEAHLLNYIANDTHCPKLKGDLAQSSSSSEWGLVYSATAGFCDDLGQIAHGILSLNYTNYGVIVHVICDEGYILNGSGILQCIPGDYPSIPVWSSSLPTCVKVEDIKGTFSPPPVAESSLCLRCIIVPVLAIVITVIGVAVALGLVTYFGGIRQYRKVMTDRNVRIPSNQGIQLT